MRLLFLLLALVWAVPQAPAQPVDPADTLRTEPIVVTDLLRIEQLGNVTVSPDGRYVVYTVRSIVPDPDDEGNYDYRTHLHLASATGNAEAGTAQARPLTRGDRSASQPVWHPDGQHVAFVRSVRGTPQVFVLSLLGGEPYQLTDLEHGATSPQFSPDGTHLLFAASLAPEEVEAATGEGPAWPIERPERTLDDVPSGVTPSPDGTLDEIRAWLAQNRADNSPRVLDRLDFQGELDLEPAETFRHLFVAPVVLGESLTEDPVRLTDGHYDHSGETWLPSGDRILFSAARTPDRHPDRVQDGDLYLVDADGQNLRLLLDLNGYTLFDPQVMPGGQTIAFRAQRQADQGFQQTEIGLYNLSGQFAPEVLTGAFDRSVSAMAWAPNGRYLYFTAPADGGFPLYRLRPFDGADSVDTVVQAPSARREAPVMRMPSVERLTDLERGVRSFGVGPATIFYVMTEITNPYELYATNVAFSEERRLTDHHTSWLRTKRISRPVSYTVLHDGYEVQYWVMRPAFYEDGQRYPLLLQIHGGPSAMWGPGEVSMWHEFQFFAARGYGIVYSNPRGSGGYGTDFRRGNYQDWGVGPAGDVLAAATEAARLPWVDTDRQVVTGGSYAGYLTAWILTQDQRFQAGAAQRGVYDLGTFLGEGNAWRLVPTHFGGYPWEDELAEGATESIRDILERNSPLTYVDQIETPFLILHGDLDLRTGVIQSEMLYKSLKILERPVEYVRYPGEGHELSRSGDPRLRLDRILRMYEFFERHID